MNIKKEIENLILIALKKKEIKIKEKIEINHPEFLKHGDFSCNIAMFLAKQEKQNPFFLANEINKFIPKNKNIEKTEVIKPGYINFYLSKTFFKDFLNKKDIFFEKDSFYSKNILLEHSSPNLFKPFHIGHLVNNSIGESLFRIIKYSGHNTIQISFPSDVSPGIAKTVWAIKKQNINLEDITVYNIADSYVLGTKEYKENEDAKKEINEINKNLYNQKKGIDWDIYLIGKKISLSHFDEIMKKLDSNFKDIIFESQAEIEGKNVINENLNKVFEKSENSNAIIFRGSKYGLFDNVFINSDGFGTYLAKDIGLLKIKNEKKYFNKENINQSLVLTDTEQSQHFQLVKKVSSLIEELKEISEKSIYLQHGRMSFSGKEKISSRYGNVPLALDLIKKIQNKILNKMTEKDFSEKEKNLISEKIAIGILKYSILKVKSGKNIVFDFEKDTNPTGNSASFLFYTFVRANSIYNKANKNKILVVSENSQNTSDLEKVLYRFSDKINISFKNYSPHFLANYLYDISKKFNQFYETTRILDEKNPNFHYNLKLVFKYAEIMKKGLNLLGIENVEKM